MTQPEQQQQHAGPAPRPNAGQEPASRALVRAFDLGFRLLRWLVLALVLAFLARSAIFVVPQHEIALVLRFGRVTGSADQRIRKPGLHFACPYPVDRVIRVAAERVHTIESDTFMAGTRAAKTAAPPPWRRSAMLSPDRDGYMMTGDANILHGKWALRYRIAEPERFVFNMAQADRLLRGELDHAIVAVSAQSHVDQALRTDVEAYRGRVQDLIRQRCRNLQLGVQIERVDVLLLAPPRQVKDAFEQVMKAENQRSEEISAARTYAARVENEARGKAARIRAEADVYKQRLVSSISADAAYFNKVYEKFAAQPLITTQTLLQDTLRRVLARVEDKYILRTTPDSRQELRILLNREKDRRPEPGENTGPMPEPKRSSDEALFEFP